MIGLMVHSFKQKEDWRVRRLTPVSSSQNPKEGLRSRNILSIHFFARDDAILWGLKMERAIPVDFGAAFKGTCSENTALSFRIFSWDGRRTTLRRHVRNTCDSPALQPAAPAIIIGQKVALTGDEGLAQTQAEPVRETAILPSRV